MGEKDGYDGVKGQYLRHWGDIGNPGIPQVAEHLRCFLPGV